jgi:hypothetical protein
MTPTLLANLVTHLRDVDAPVWHVVIPARHICDLQTIADVYRLDWLLVALGARARPMGGHLFLSRPLPADKLHGHQLQQMDASTAAALVEALARTVPPRRLQASEGWSDAARRRLVIDARLTAALAGGPEQRT